MSELLLGLALGLSAMWTYSKLARLSELASLKAKKRVLMKEALTHTGSFSELIFLLKALLRVAFTHLRLVFIPALIACAPLIIFVVIMPQFATLYFAGGVLAAYLFAKWRWGI